MISPISNIEAQSASANAASPTPSRAAGRVGRFVLRGNTTPMHVKKNTVKKFKRPVSLGAIEILARFLNMLCIYNIIIYIYARSSPDISLALLSYSSTTIIYSLAIGYSYIASSLIRVRPRAVASWGLIT